MPVTGRILEGKLQNSTAIAKHRLRSQRIIRIFFLVRPCADTSRSFLSLPKDRISKNQELRLPMLRKASLKRQIGGSETQHFLYPRAPIAAPRTLYCPQTEERSASHPRINSRVSNRSPKWPKMDRIIAKMAKWTPTVVFFQRT